jgi:Mrp family chromosome partitioning ATPase/capsular polysaccharide biosynthesis protein
MIKMEEPGMYYLHLMIRYWFVIMIFAVLTGVASLFFQSRQPRLYESSVKIFIGNALTSPDPQVSSFESAERLAVTYAELIRSYQFLAIAIQEVDPNIDVDLLIDLVSVQVVSETSILIINVRYPDPPLAADLANAIAVSLITETPSTLTEAQMLQLERIQRQIDSLEALIDVTSNQHQQEVSALNTSEENIDLATRLTDQLNASFGSLALLENEYQKLSTRISTIEVIDEARPNPAPLGLSPIIVVGAGVFLGIVIAVAGITIVDMFDTTIRTEDDVIDHIDVPVIGSISTKRWSSKKFQAEIASANLLSNEVFSQYRAVLSNVVFSSTDDLSEKSSRLVIVSPQRGNGRTFTAINLALSAVESGLKVLLVDFDGVRPSIHEHFNLNNENYALSRLINYISYNKAVLKEDKRIAYLHEKVVRPAPNYPNLDILVAGRPAARQTRTIPSLRELSTFLDRVSELFAYDVIVIDTPATEDSSDAVNLAGVSKCRLLLVIETRGTTESIATKTVADFGRVGRNIDGIIMN